MAFVIDHVHTYGDGDDQRNADGTYDQEIERVVTGERKPNAVEDGK
jgi:hypothetical protein